MSLDEKRWVTARFAVSVQESGVADVQELLAEYEELLVGWEVVVEEDGRLTEEGASFFRVSLQPGPQALISPRELARVRAVLVESAALFVKQLGARETQVFHDPLSGIETLSMTKEELEGFWCFAFKARGVPYTNVLTFTFPAGTRVLFDEEFPVLARELFGATVKELVAGFVWYPSWWSRLWRGREYVQALARSRRRAKQWFGIEYDSLRES